MQVKVLLNKPDKMSLAMHFEEHLKYYFQQGLVVYRWLEKDEKIEVILETPERILAESLCDQRKSINLLEKQTERMVLAFKMLKTRDVMEDLNRWIDQIELLNEARATLLDYCRVQSFGGIQLKTVLSNFSHAIEDSDWKAAARVLEVEVKEYFSFCRKDLDFCQSESGGNSVL